MFIYITIGFILGFLLGLYLDGTVFLDPQLIRLKERRDRMLPPWLRNRYT